MTQRSGLVSGADIEEEPVIYYLPGSDRGCLGSSPEEEGEKEGGGCNSGYWSLCRANS